VTNSHLQDGDQDYEIALELGYTVTYTTHMTRARKIDIVRGRALCHHHCANMLPGFLSKINFHQSRGEFPPVLVEIH
jgi:hypothetical protein